MTKKLGQFVKRSSREPVVSNLKKIKRKYFPNQKLIAANNPLQSNAIGAIRNHRDITKQFELKPNDVGTYIAASSLSHLLDGWGYLANSVNALLNGNEGVAIHLAYYGELRAVMSFLGSEGIGVFSDNHLGLYGDEQFETFAKYKRKEWVKGQGYATIDRKIGTHVFAWEALDKWCKSGVKPSFDILKIFKVKGFDFHELTQGFHPSATVLLSSTIAKGWLTDWAFDVKKYKGDRDLRNLVSYRPQTITDCGRQMDFEKSIKDIYKLFEVLSPLESNPFHYLDLLLLKALFEELYANPLINSSGSFEDLVENAFSNLGASLDAQTRRIILSGRPNIEGHLVFQESNKFEIAALPIISRAALLLRISTGAVSLLLKEASIEKDDLNFVWDSYGFNNGFWKSLIPVSEFIDLWTEVENEYNEISDKMDSIENNLHSFKNELEEDIGKLCQFNRAVLWGI